MKNTFLIGIEETKKYLKQYYFANAPSEFISSSGFKLGRWQYSQHAKYKSGKLLPAEIEALENLGFLWKSGATPDESFEIGFQETVKYKNSTGTANAPTKHVTDDGYNLGSWQAYQKSRYKEGRISQERINKLESIGFKLQKRKNIIEKMNEW